MALLSQALHLGYLLSPHSAFQGHAAHTARWPAMLSPNGSSDTCISAGVFHIPMPCFHGALPVYPKVVITFLHNASRRTRRALHASCDPPQVAFQEHAAHPPRWPGELSSKGSSDTCISDGVSTFLYRAFTAHGTHLAGLASPHGLVHDLGVVLDRGNPSGSAMDTGLDFATSALRAEPAVAGGVLHTGH